MADVEAKFKIKAEATGFTKLTTSAEKLAAAFKKVGDAGAEMGKKTAEGLRAQQAAFDSVYKANRGGLGKATDLLFGRKGGGFGGGFGGGGGGGGGAGRGGGGGGGGSSGSRGPRATGAKTIETGMSAVDRIAVSLGLKGSDEKGDDKSGPSRKANKAEGSFTQGFLQGSNGNAYIDRGPGMLQQAVGQFVGRKASEAVFSVINSVSSVTDGPEAMASAGRTLPFIGNRIGRGASANIAAARQEHSAQSAFAGMMPYINAGKGAYLGRMLSERRRLGEIGLGDAGMSQNESLTAFASATAQAGGVTGMYSDKQLSRAMLARQGMGIDLGTSMRLLRQEDLGNASKGSSFNTLAQGLGNAKGLDLIGSEKDQYLRRMAASLEEVTQTGIKFSAAGQGALEKVMQTSLGGLTGARASVLEQSLSRGMADIARDGPQNASEAMTLQDAGYDPNDPETLEPAYRALEDPEQRVQIAKKGLKRFMRGSKNLSQNQRAGLLTKYLKQHKTFISHTEAQKAIKSGQLGSSFVDSITAPAPMSDQELATGRDNVSGSAYRQSAMANQTTEMGTKALDTVNTADEHERRFTESVKDLGKNFLELGNSINQLGHQVSDFVFPDVGKGAAQTDFR